MIKSNIKSTTRLSSCKRLETEDKVLDNQALTPAKMYALAQQGKPISAQQMPSEYFDDGQAYQTYDIPVDRQRGIDVIQCWEASKDSQNKLNTFKSKNIVTKQERSE